jgi:uncharacterized protein YfeS
MKHKIKFGEWVYYPNFKKYFKEEYYWWEHDCPKSKAGSTRALNNNMECFACKKKIPYNLRFILKLHDSNL